jgi:ketosteroid isomerase-like protein
VRLIDRLVQRVPKEASDVTTAEVTTTPTEAVEQFLGALARRDVEAAMASIARDARVIIYPLGVRDSSHALRGVLNDLVVAFPDLLLSVKRVITTGDVIAAEFKVEGTQAADYAGAINQEKHLDVDQAWRFTVRAGLISEVHAYWCQQQMLRRLGVKRFDQIAIV